MIKVTVDYLLGPQTLPMFSYCYWFPTMVPLLGRGLPPPSTKPTCPNFIHPSQEAFPEYCSSPSSNSFSVSSGHWVRAPCVGALPQVCPGLVIPAGR